LRRDLICDVMVAMKLCYLPAAVLCALASASVAASAEYHVYIGTYTGPESKGIYRFHFDTRTGKLTPAGVAAETPSPSFLALHPNRRFLYAVNEVAEFQGEKGGMVSAFAIAPDGSLTSLNQVSSRGAGPCHLTLDNKGTAVLVANYGGGNAALIPVKPDGTLEPASAFVQHEGSGPNQGRQRAPHAHCANFTPDNRFALITDLGIDQVMVYRYNGPQGGLTPHTSPSARVAPGAGPRHLAFHPSGKFAWVINELGSTITGFSYAKGPGTFREVQTLSTLPSDFQGQNSTAEIAVHPNGRWVYGSNRGHDSIAVYRVNGTTGALTLVEHTSTGGRTPRNFALDPKGEFLFAANQDSGNIVVFRVDSGTGRLTPTGVEEKVSRPVAILFVPVSKQK
jgi:6-phosphogluconolactonase